MISPLPSVPSLSNKEGIATFPTVKAASLLKRLTTSNLRLLVSDPATSLSDTTDLKDQGLDIFNVKLPEKTIRTPEQAFELRRTIALLARVFSKNYQMEVLPAPGGGWACGVAPEIIPDVEAYITGEKPSLDHIDPSKFKPTQIFYDVKDILEAPKEEVYGVLRHEVGHANHSDYPLFFKGQRIAHEQGAHPTTWMQIHNALEDPWVNNLEIRDSEVVRKQMTQLYAARFPEIEAKIDTQPITHQLGLNINYYWITGKNIPGLKNKDVLETFEKIRPHVDAYFKGATAQENFDNVLKNIWPHVKVLEEKAQKDEEKKELARNLSGSELGSGSGKSSPQPGGGGSGGGQEEDPSQSGSGQTSQSQGQGGGQHDDNPFRKSKQTPQSRQEQEENLPWYKRLFRRKKKKDPIEEMRKRLEEEAQRSRQEEEYDRNKAAQRQQQEEQARQAQAQRQVQQKQPETYQERLARELNNQEQEQKKENRNTTRRTGKPPSLADDISLSKLSREIRDELEKRYNALSQSEKDALKEKAKEQLDRKQAESLEKNGQQGLESKKDSKLGKRIVSFRKAPDAKDIEELKKELEKFQEQLEAQEAQEGEAARAAEQKRIEKEMQASQAKRELTKNGFTEYEIEHFRRYRELEGAMKGKVHSFLRALEEYLPKKETTIYEGEHYTGTRLNEKAVLRRAPLEDYRVFSRRQPVQSDEPRMFVTLLIDNSGSMGGQKMEESLKTAIFWARVLREFQIPFSIKFFGSQVVDIMKFSDDYDDPRKRIKPNIVTKADASGGHTDIGTPLEQTLAEMRQARKQYPDCFGSVFVISDSGANVGKVGGALKSLIEKMQGEFLVMNFILSTSEGEVQEAKSYFGEKNVIAPKTFADLPNDAFKTLRIVLDRVLKIYRPQ